MNIAVVGHVDHGKSTIIGRLLADSKSLPEGRLEQIKFQCEQNARPFEYAFLLDALKDEQMQGITIDIARCFFKTEKRRYLILDAPGHVEFLKNMITGAACAEVAFLVIDAKEGVQDNSRRHAYLLSMLEIKQVVVLINKMDLVNYAKEKFEQIKCLYMDFLKQINLTPLTFIPVSGLKGDFIVKPTKNMPWYIGDTVISILDKLEKKPALIELPFRMPVQDVYKFTEHDDTRRIIAGKVTSGSLNVGDEVIFYPSGKTSFVQSIEKFNVLQCKKCQAGESVGFTLTEQLYVRRGEVAARITEPKLKSATIFKANVFWLGRRKLSTGKDYFIKLGTAKVQANLERVIKILDAASLKTIARDEIQRHEVAECIFRLRSPVALEVSIDNLSLSRFVVIDGFDIAGGGIVSEVMLENNGDILCDSFAEFDIVKACTGTQQQNSNAECADSCLAQKGHVLWFTGLSGAGKTTLAIELSKRLSNRKKLVYRLDGDNLRQGLNADLGFSTADRKENIRRIAHVAALFMDAGYIVIVSVISPHAEMREYARNLIGQEHFSEFYIRASIDICQHRDPKGYYKKANNGEVLEFTGISANYDEPTAPDLIIDTEKNSIEDCMKHIETYIYSKVLCKMKLCNKADHS